MPFRHIKFTNLTTATIDINTASEYISSSQSYQNFINAIRSPATKRVYVNSLKRYMKHLKITDTDELLKTNVPKVIESHLVDYIISLRKDGVSYAFMKHAVAPIFTFYQLKDILLNRKKIARYFGECKRVTKDKAYNTEQIQQALATADHRMRMIILLLASTGCRLGTIQLLPLLA